MLVLSSLQFKGAPNKSNGKLEITVDDGDSYTTNATKTIDISINPSPPSIVSPSYKLDVKATKASSISGLKITDIDSQEVEVSLSGTKGIINGASVNVYSLENAFAEGEQITVANASYCFSVSSGKTSAEDVILSPKGL